MKNLYFHNMAEGVEAFSTERDFELPYHVIQAHQTHQDKVAVIDRPDYTREELEGIDAMITNLPGVAIGARTADCIPVLMYDPVHRAVAAVHCGWRGTVLRISQKAIAKMGEEYGTQAKDIIAVVGPGIGPQSFQVGSEVAEEFAKAGFPMDAILTDEGPRVEGTMHGGLHVDLWEANRRILADAGVSNIQVTGICTYERNDMFYSARREGTACPRIINSIKLI